jgi:hypothetical protein
MPNRLRLVLWFAAYFANTQNGAPPHAITGQAPRMQVCRLRTMLHGR